MLLSRISVGASIAALAGATFLMLTPASAFTLSARSLEQSSSPIEYIWWDRWGHWHGGWRPAQPHYRCWHPLHGPRRCDFGY
jgi:hypothetical protein